LQAAMGLAVLPYMDNIIEERKKVVDFYNNYLNFSIVKALKIRENTNWNYSYYPVIFETEPDLLRVVAELNKISVVPRRYFYPSLNTLNYIDSESMPVSESVASRILCLPLYVGLEIKHLEKMVQILNTLNQNVS